jgi:hypothetical protein
VPAAGRATYFLMLPQISAVSRFRTPRRRAFTFLEVLLVLGIIGLFIVCIIGFFASRGVEPLKPPPPSATPAPAKAPPAAPAPAEPVAPPRPAEPAP